MLPDSLDRVVTQDELLGLIERSPHTKELVGMRASEIVSQIVNSAIESRMTDKLESAY